MLLQTRESEGKADKSQQVETEEKKDGVFKGAIQEATRRRVGVCFQTLLDPPITERGGGGRLPYLERENAVSTSLNQTVADIKRAQPSGCEILSLGRKLERKSCVI